MYSRLVLAFALLGSTASAAVVSQSFSGTVYTCGDDYSCPFIAFADVSLFDPSLGEFQKMSITLNIWGEALATIGDGPWGVAPSGIAGEHIPYPNDWAAMGGTFRFYSGQIPVVEQEWGVAIPRSSENNEWFSGSAQGSWTSTYQTSILPTPFPEPSDPYFRLDIRMIGFDGVGMYGNTAFNGFYSLAVDYEYGPPSGDDPGIPAAVPEPTSAALMLSGIGLFLWRRRLGRMAQGMRT